MSGISTLQDGLCARLMLSAGAFGEGYYERRENSNYEHYRWRPRLMAVRLSAILLALHTRPGSRILDFGCAKGFYVAWLRARGYDAVGVDISRYAVGCAPSQVRPFIHLLSDDLVFHWIDRPFDLAIAKDVLEHIEPRLLPNVVSMLRAISRQAVITVPVCDERRRFVNVSDERDGTHVTRYSRGEWLELFKPSQPLPGLCKRLKGRQARGTLCVALRS